MIITTTFRVVYDPGKDGSLREFRNKFTKMRDHVLAMQAKGLIPAGDIYWITTVKKAPIMTPEGPDAPSGGSAASALPFPSQRIHPMVFHMPGTPMDMERIAA